MIKSIFVLMAAISAVKGYDTCQLDKLSIQHFKDQNCENIDVSKGNKLDKS